MSDDPPFFIEIHADFTAGQEAVKEFQKSLSDSEAKLAYDKAYEIALIEGMAAHKFFEEHHLRRRELKAVLLKMRSGLSFKLAMELELLEWAGGEESEGGPSTELQAFKYTVENDI